MPNTDYVLSAYLWNMGEAANHVTTVVDFNDAPQEPQLTLSYSDANADQGYFVYRSFNTANTGSNVTCESSTMASPVRAPRPGYWPLAAQWDNIAITRGAADFVPPQAPAARAGTSALSSASPVPRRNEHRASTSARRRCKSPPPLPTYDGSVAKVEFYAGGTKLGETNASPYHVWFGPTLASGTWQLTAVATDNGGATTVSAPVTIRPRLRFRPRRSRLSIASDCRAISGFVLADLGHGAFPPVRSRAWPRRSPGTSVTKPSLSSNDQIRCHVPHDASAQQYFPART